MRLSLDRARPSRLRGIILGLTGALLAAGTLSGVVTPAAAGVLPSKMTANVTIAESGESVTLRASVTVATVNTTLQVTPSGSIKFTTDVGDNLGSVAVPACLLKECPVAKTVPASAFSSGVSRIIATYSGDTVLNPVSVGIPFGFDRCVPEDGCFADARTAAAEIYVTSDSDEGYVMDSLGGPGLPCGIDNGGLVGNVNGVGLNAQKEVYYMLEGAPAKAYYDRVTALDGMEWFCYVSPVQFDAFSTDGYSTDFPANSSSFTTFGPAPQIGSGPYNNQYVGLLASCSYTGDVAPCIESYTVGLSEGPNSWFLSVYLDVPPGDPHMGGLKLPALPKLSLPS